jgi:GTPase
VKREALVGKMAAMTISKLGVGHWTFYICFVPRCGTIALAGRPNVGKSTLLNALVGEHLAIVSPKPQSTRVPVVGLVTRDDAQFIFTDSPGLLEPEYKLHEAMRAAAVRAIADADVIAYLHPLPEFPAPPLEQVAKLNRPPNAPIVTVYTKADLAASSTALHHPPPPSTVVVSAVTRDGLDALFDVLRTHLPEGPFHYDPDEMATQPSRFFAAEFVREAAFEQLREELPYSVAVEIDEFREGASPVYIRAVVYVERDSQKGILIGDGGRTIKALGQTARAKIEALLGERVFLELHVKVLPKWRRHEPSLKRLGYSV